MSSRDHVALAVSMRLQKHIFSDLARNADSRKRSGTSLIQRKKKGEVSEVEGKKKRLGRRTGKKREKKEKKRKKEGKKKQAKRRTARCTQTASASHWRRATQ